MIFTCICLMINLIKNVWVELLNKISCVVNAHVIILLPKFKNI